MVVADLAREQERRGLAAMVAATLGSRERESNRGLFQNFLWVSFETVDSIGRVSKPDLRVRLIWYFKLQITL